MITKKRGRPSKASLEAQLKKDALALKKHEELHEANIQRLIAERAPVHWEEVAQKQEVELQVLRQENEELARICMARFEKIEDWMKIVKYLEGRVEDLTVRSRQSCS